MAHTAPLSVISPVTARVDGTERPVRRLTNANMMAVPADGPSFLTAPLGKWSWDQHYSELPKVDTHMYIDILQKILRPMGRDPQSYSP